MTDLWALTAAETTLPDQGERDHRSRSRRSDAGSVGSGEPRH